MITIKNLKSMLDVLGFIKSGNTYVKRFPQYDCELSVDFNRKKLIYPAGIRGRERNDSFDAPENFVVFECVNRLLEKGYRPEHIELEKKWHLGHDAKSGRADICVSSFDGNMLFIVECKTAGREFEKAYKDTCADGGSCFLIGSRKDRQSGSCCMRLISTVTKSPTKHRSLTVRMTPTLL